MSTTTNLITLKAIVLSQRNDNKRKYRFKHVLYTDTDFKAYPGIIFHLMTEDCLARRHINRNCRNSEKCVKSIKFNTMSWNFWNLFYILKTNFRQEGSKFDCKLMKKIQSKIQRVCSVSKRHKFKNIPCNLELPPEIQEKQLLNMGKKFGRLWLDIFWKIVKMFNLCKLGWQVERAFLKEVEHYWFTIFWYEFLTATRPVQ